MPDRTDLLDDGDQATSTEVNENSFDQADALAEAFAIKTRDQWMEEFARANICVGPVSTTKGVLEHPQTLHRKMVVEIVHPHGGVTRQIGSPFRLSQCEVDVDRLPALQHGEHTF